MNKYFIINHIKNALLLELINILKQIEEQKYNESDEYIKLQYDWKEIERLIKEINDI